jgi:hypothetical protein
MMQDAQRRPPFGQYLQIQTLTIVHIDGTILALHNIYDNVVFRAVGTISCPG